MSIDPIKATEAIERSYRSYLATTFSFQDEELKKKFQEKLNEPGKLVNGPILEATPLFKKSSTINDMIEEGVLSKGLRLLESEDFPLDRPFYEHQEKSIRKVVVEKRNIIVATGTGSGKTETFMVPIINHLLREKENGALTPGGVRALLLYPMNALVNDQLTRLRKYLKNCPFITFGRYTGETKEDYNEALENYRKNNNNQDPLDNELISRDKMRKTPPHILVTNYAMLEYLLLRPEDNEFFDGEYARNWRFIVMDEVHTYGGAKGIEMAMLIRRLKDRVVRSEPGKIQCIGTSATLGSGREDFKRITEFAQNLFGEKFEWDDDGYAKQDVIESSKIPLTDIDADINSFTDINFSKVKLRLPAQVYSLWRDIVRNAEMNSEQKIKKLVDVAADLNVPREILEEALAHTGYDDYRKFLYQVIKQDELLYNLQLKLQKGPIYLSELSKEITDGDEESLVSIIDLAVMAQPSENMQPLLPARHHVFVRAVEGAYIKLVPTREIYLERYEKIKEDETEYSVFEAATCRYCGTCYLAGNIATRKIDVQSVLDRKPVNTTSNLYLKQVSDLDFENQYSYFLILDRSVSFEMLNEDDEVELRGIDQGQNKKPKRTNKNQKHEAKQYSLYDNENPKIHENYEEYEQYLLCGKCAAIDNADIIGNICSCGEEYYLKILRIPTDNEGRVFLCPACGRRSSQNIIRRFLVGSDAAASVLGTALYQQIQPKIVKVEDRGNQEDELHEINRKLDEYNEYDEYKEEPRKLLIFSDNRQDAAFFAPYFNRTYNQILIRSLIVRVLSQYKTEILENFWRLQDMVIPLQRFLTDASYFTQTGIWGIQSQKDEILKWLMGELIGMDTIINLEAFGLLKMTLAISEKMPSPGILLEEPWNLNKEEALTVIRVLLDTLRLSAAVSFPERVSPKDEHFYPRNHPRYFRANKSASLKGIMSWNTTRYNSRLDYIVRLAKNINPKITMEDCRKILNLIWVKYLDLGNQNSPWKDFFSETRVSGEGVVYQLRHEQWEIRSSLVHKDMKWYICDKCQRITPYNVKGTCTTYRCNGSLRLCRPEEIHGDNHYYKLYMNTNPIYMKAEEHTAQLTSDGAAEVQNRFINGNINVLSCSTTFELGVDVGELETVFMRNMPPSAANYIQRAGRAGRRVDTTAYALTFAQRRSHDLVHFYQPWRMVEGQIQAPYVTLDNEKIIRRHIYATALAMFWSEYRKFYGTVESFYFNEKGSGVDHFQAFLGRQPRKLEEALKRIVPVHMHEVLGISDWSWTKELFEEKNSPMQKARYILESDINEINELIEQLVKKRRYVDNLIRLSQTILSKNIIESMSTSNILPKYGFPVDVVELSLLHHGEEAKRLQLERDLRLALSEYAPSSKVVAGGKIWTSRYIKALPNRAWEKYRYAICEYCHSYHRIREEFVDAGAKFDVCPLCKQPFGRRKKTFLIPAFGFIADTRAPDKPGEKKPERMYSTRVYYSGEADEENCVRINMGYTEVELISASHGKLAVINTGKGKGFKVCHRCGYSALIDEKAASSHKTSMGGECRGTLSGSYSLGHEFETDILRITLNGYRDTREGFWYSLLYAILEGISLALEIDRNDLDGCLYPTAGDRCKPSLILFDDVPGGAGHVKRMSNQKEWLNILKVTLERMEQCECGGKEGNSSCYGCLRNYRNQFCHDVLNRGMVIDFLKTLI